MLTNRLLCRTAHSPSRGGFTLVELLVVIGIIAILAGVALGPITNGIKKAKQSAALQSAHAIGLGMYSLANDNSQNFPDNASTGPGVPSGNAAGPDARAGVWPLLAGGYVTDPSIFFISGGVATKFTGTAASAAGNIAVANISWDFMGNAGNGVSATNYQYVPVLWTSITTKPSVANLPTATTGSMYGIPSTGNPFGTDGMAIFYNNNASKFVTSSLVGTTKEVLMVDPTTNSGGAPSSLAVLSGGG